jgi:hypothetical protein
MTKSREAKEMENSPNGLMDNLSPIDSREISIYDMDNPNSILQLVKHSKPLAQAVLKADQILMLMDEGTLRQKLGPSAIDNRLRLAFWVEVDNALNAGASFVEQRVYAGIVTKEVWNKKYLTNPKKMAWLLTPVGNYESSMMEALETGVSQLRKILSAPIFDEQGKLDTKAAKIVVDVFKLLDERVRGTVVQKHKIIHEHRGNVPENTAPVIDIDEKLRMLEQQIAQNDAKNGGLDE